MTGDVSADPHGEIPFRYFRGQVESVGAVVFLFHGRGGDAQSVYEQLGQHLLRDDLIVVVAEAYSNCWYPYRFNEPETVNQPWLDSAVASIHREVSSLLEQGQAIEPLPKNKTVATTTRRTNHGVPGEIVISQ